MIMSGEIEKFRICQKFNLEVLKTGCFYLKILQLWQQREELASEMAKCIINGGKI